MSDNKNILTEETNVNVDVTDTVTIIEEDFNENPDGEPVESVEDENKSLNESEATGAQKVLFDAEKIDLSAEENKEILFDAEEEIKKKEFENRDINPDDIAKIMEENPDANPDDYVISEEQKNVFDDGLQDGQFIPRHRCPMCMFGKKSISELYVRKRFSRKKRVVGYIAVCANCGHVDLYTDNPIDLLGYLRGKIKY